MTTTTPHGGTSAAGQPTLAVLAARPDADVRLYCFPPAGFGPEFYLPWSPLLAPTIELCAVCLPGHGAVADQLCVTDLRQLTAALADLVHTPGDNRPFALFGHSSGALLAFTTACRLRRTHHRLPVLLAVSAFPAPHLDTYGRTFGLRLVSGQTTIADFIGPLYEPTRLTPDQVATALAPLFADFLLSLQYRHHDEAALELDLALYGGKSDPVVPIDQLGAWNDLATTPATPCLFPGGHMYPLDQAEALIDQLDKDLHAALRHIAP
ncbi:MAG: thioesterase II family protein [Pseudonocardiales bacterium]